MSEDVQEKDYGDDEYSVYRKLMDLQRAIKVIPKDANNSRMGYKYASSSAVLAKVREQMDELGLLLLFDVKHHEVKENAAYKGVQSLTIINVAATFVDADNPQSQVTLTWPGQGADDGEKGVGKALTYMEKYNILKCLHIPTDEADPDSDVSPDMEDAPECSKCGKPMAIRSGKNGEFYGCTGYPKCKNTMPVDSEDEVEDDSGNAKSTITTSKTRPEDSKKSGESRKAELWDETWDLITQVRGVEKGDEKTVDAMKKWARRQTDGEIDELSDWTPDMIIRFRGIVDKQAEEMGDDE